MPAVRELLHSNITYSEAKEEQVNLLIRFKYPSRRDDFFGRLKTKNELIASLVAHHLGVKSTRCHVSLPEKWMNGSFNLCVPVSVDNARPVLIRFPLPYRTGESYNNGNCDEKVRCEAGTYAWLDRQCPAIPKPILYGFALSNGTNVCSQTEDGSNSTNANKASNFVQHPHSLTESLGPYMVMEYLEVGQPLSQTWESQKNDLRRRHNLFRGLSRLLLSISRVSLPEIGSFIIAADGTLSLKNRPLLMMLQELENDEIPTIPRDLTFRSVDSYVNALLRCHKNRIVEQPNAIMNLTDGIIQLTALVLMQAIAPHFFDAKLNHGPFVYGFADIHPSNLHVDEDWNIVGIFDLEWCASEPLEFMQPPTWLTDEAVDEISVSSFNPIRQEFMRIFKEEESRCTTDYYLSRTQILETSWALHTFWYQLALQNPSGFHQIFWKRIQSLYSRKTDADDGLLLHVSPYGTPGAFEFLEQKLVQKTSYDTQLKTEFDIDV